MPIDFEEEVNITDVYDEIWFNIINRTITPKDDTKMQDVLVQNDANSRNLCFMIQRYFEDEDLSEKNIRIHFVNSLNQHDYSDAHTIEICGIDDDVLSFKWLVDNKVCRETGNVKFAIEFYDSTTGYELFTKPTIIQVEEGIYTVGEMQENVDWYQTLRNEVADLKQQVEDLENAGIDDLEAINIPHNIRITSFDDSTVNVIFGFVDGNEGSGSITLDLSENKSVTVYLYKIYIDEETDMQWILSDETPENVRGRVYAFNYTVENGEVTYLSTSDVNYLLEDKIEIALDAIIAEQEAIIAIQNSFIRGETE